MDKAYMSRLENDRLPSLPSCATINSLASALSATEIQRIALFVAARKLPPEVETGLLDNPALLSMVIRDIKCASQVRKKGKG